MQPRGSRANLQARAAGESISQTVRTGKGRHHHHGLSEGHHHHRHKKHHHARRHHDDTDDESTEDERERDTVSSTKDRSLDTSDTDDGRLPDEDDLQEEKVPHRSRRKEPEPEEEDAGDVDEDDQEWEDGEEREDPPRRHRTRHSDFEEQRDQRAAPEPLEASPAETETTKKTEQPATTNPSMTGNPVREAVAHSPPPGPSARCSQCDLGLDFALFWLDNCYRTGHFGSSSNQMARVEQHRRALCCEENESIQQKAQRRA